MHLMIEPEVAEVTAVGLPDTKERGEVDHLSELDAFLQPEPLDVFSDVLTYENSVWRQTALELGQSLGQRPALGLDDLGRQSSELCDVAHDRDVRLDVKVLNHRAYAVDK